MKPFSFPRRERLSSKKIIDKLFAQGSTVFHHPIMCKVIVEDTAEENTGIQVLIVVPKKKIKKAADRNRIRRRIREAYRINKLPLHKFKEQENKHIYIAFVYVSSDELNFTSLQSAIIKITQEIVTKKGLEINDVY